MKKFAGILLMLLLLCGAALAENTYHVEEFSIEKPAKKKSSPKWDLLQGNLAEGVEKEVQHK